MLDLDAFLSLPRVAGLAVSPDGRRLVTGVATLAEDGTSFTSALWEIDPTGDGEPRRLTRSAKGEGGPVFTPEGDLLFVSARPGATVTDRPGEKAATSEPSEEVPRLWRLPADGGEAELLAAPPAGVAGIKVARGSGAVLLRTALHPGAEGWEADAEREKARKDAKVTAQLVEHYPIRFWDRWIGPRQPRWQLGAGAAADVRWVDLVPDPGFSLEEQGADVSADGRLVALTRATVPDDPRNQAEELVVLRIGEDGAVAEERVLLAEERVSLGAPALSPDGRRVAVVRRPLGDPSAPPDQTIVVVDLDSGAAEDVLEGFDRWPGPPLWTPDGTGLLFTADDDGRTLPFHVDLASGEVRRLAAEGVWTDLVLAPDGRTLYAVRGDVAAPPHVVAVDLDGGEVRVLHAPAAEAADAAGLGRVERVETTAEDGARVPGWLIVPPAAEGGADGPAPLAVLIHGGPLASWSGWHWRWNPHVLAARGYAVLCPDPALSTGYGLDFVRRGWGRWGAEPYTDILALTDAVQARDDVDASRSAALGGSFGGYMANWVAGHTDRFDAIVTHASLWNLEAFHGTTDVGPWWENEFGDRYTEPERYREWSPHRFVGDIRTPMLVIHGERDFRVPVSEGVSLWTDLRRHGVEARYLHFPDENHWILKPQHTRLWYATVLAFLDHHVRDEPWERPDLL
jgi:dipeptidyl aminopeptidase/acylaminoacyl peptidase